MGRAEVLENLGEAEYKVKILRWPERVQDLIDGYSARHDGVTSKLDQADVDLDQIDQTYDDLYAKYDKKITYYSTLDPQEDEEEISTIHREIVQIHKELITLKNKRRNIQIRQKQLEAFKAEMDRKIQELESLKGGEERTVWCADYTMNYGVGSILPTISVNGEYWDILLAPQHTQLPRGEFLPIKAMTTAQAIYNFAIHPGWQRHMPTYRAGTLQNVDYFTNTGTVDIGEADSFYQSLPVNKKQLLNGVPFKYLNCDAVAFTAGDEVIVEFEDQDWTKPRIVGFYNSPEPCFFHAIRFEVAGYFVIWNMDQDVPMKISGQNIGLNDWPLAVDSDKGIAADEWWSHLVGVVVSDGDEQSLIQIEKYGNSSGKGDEGGLQYCSQTTTCTEVDDGGEWGCGETDESDDWRIYTSWPLSYYPNYEKKEVVSDTNCSLTDEKTGENLSETSYDYWYKNQNVESEAKVEKSCVVISAGSEYIGDRVHWLDGWPYSNSFCGRYGHNNLHSYLFECNGYEDLLYSLLEISRDERGWGTGYLHESFEENDEYYGETEFVTDVDYDIKSVEQGVIHQSYIGSRYRMRCVLVEDGGYRKCEELLRESAHAYGDHPEIINTERNNNYSFAFLNLVLGRDPNPQADSPKYRFVSALIRSKHNKDGLESDFNPFLFSRREGFEQFIASDLQEAIGEQNTMPDPSVVMKSLTV